MEIKEKFDFFYPFSISQSGYKSIVKCARKIRNE